MKTVTLAVVVAAAFGFAAPAAEAATCPQVVAHPPTLYEGGLVTAHGTGCTGAHSGDVLSVLSRDRSGDVSVLRSCSFAVGGPVNTHFHCRSRVVCVHQLLYRSFIAFGGPLGESHDRSPWKRLC